MSRLIFFFLALVLAGTAPVAAQDESGDAAESSATKFEKLIEGATHHDGFFDLYEKDGHLYLAVPRERLGQDFLLNFEIAQGIGAGGVFGGTMLSIFEPAVVALEQHGAQVYLVQRPHRYVAQGGTPAEASVALSYGSSVLQSAKVAATRGDSALVVDVHDWFVSDLSGISERLKRAVSDNGQPGRVSFDRGRSYLEAVRAFPENVNVRAKLTFTPGEPASLRSVPDGRYVPVSIYTVLAALPERPMEPREADDRMGYFMTVHKDFSQEEETFFRRYVNRWRLECADARDDEQRADGLCTPREPITYYIDRTVPERYRPVLVDAVEAFDAAFEEAGFRDAIRAEVLPEGADPEDIRYATLRWSTSDQPGYGAIGPSIVDPRTGEILDADILIEANMVLGFKDAWRTYVGPKAAVESMFHASPQELRALSMGAEAAGFGAEMAAQGNLLRAVLAARGEIGPEDEVPASYVDGALKWVTMHEVGHTLGLRHNFRSSVDTPLDKLYDAAWTAEHGVFSSVMEYPTVNLAPNGQADGHFYNQGMGTSDRWVIAYGYTPDAARARALARQAALPGHAYGTDEDARGPGALDPTVNVYDLGSDPLAWGKQRAELIRGLWADLPANVLSDNDAYHELTEAFETLAGQYARAVAAGIKYIGGQYQYRDHVGDPNARAPFVNVPKAKQEEALAFIVDYAFDEDAFDVPQEVLQKFGANRWSHWGVENTHQGRIDYPLHETVLGTQQAILAQITHPFAFARIRDAELKFGASEVLTLPELFDGLTEAIWAEAWTPPGRDVPAQRRDLQRAYLDRLVTLATDAPDRTPADARAVARLRLEDLHARLAKRLTPPAAFDAYTLAHLKESKARIEAALQASLSLGE